jgi:hypothetical protein
MACIWKAKSGKGRMVEVKRLVNNDWQRLKEDEGDSHWLTEDAKG